jgi:hypothetical protein
MEGDARRQGNDEDATPSLDDRRDSQEFNGIFPCVLFGVLWVATGYFTQCNGGQLHITHGPANYGHMQWNNGIVPLNLRCSTIALINNRNCRQVMPESTKTRTANHLSTDLKVGLQVSSTD